MLLMVMNIHGIVQDIELPQHSNKDNPPSDCKRKLREIVSEGTNSYTYKQLKQLFRMFRGDRCKVERTLIEIWERNGTLPAKPILLRVSDEGNVQIPLFLDYFENKASYTSENPLSPVFLDSEEDSEFRIVKDWKNFFHQLDRNGTISPSFMHLLVRLLLSNLLVIPSRVRKYNVLSMRGKKDAEMLLRMKDKAINFFKEENNRRGVVDAIRTAFESALKKRMGENGIDKSDVRRYRKKLERFSAVLINDLGLEKDLEFYLHSFPNFSVGQLHLHVKLSSVELVRRRSGDKLNLDDVVYFLSRDSE
jgi:hypothetical protein